MDSTRTSLTHPLRVDWLLEGQPGALGLTFAPGKQASGVTGAWHRDLDLDLTALRQVGVDVLVCLLEAEEMAWLGIEQLPESAGAVGLRFVHFPIRDGAVPVDLPAATALVRRLGAEVRAGARVVVHCRGGLGRAGTIGACTLLELGACRDGAEAIALVRKRRSPAAVETAEQERFVHRIYATMSKKVQ